MNRIKFMFVLVLTTGFNIAFGQEAPWQDGLENVIKMLTGGTATAFATIAVIILGYLAMVGRMEMKLAGSIIAGIVLVFGAPHVVSWFS